MANDFRDLESKENERRMAMGLPPLPASTWSPKRFEPVSDQEIEEYVERVREIAKKLYPDDVERQERHVAEARRLSEQSRVANPVGVKRRKTETKKKPASTDSYIESSRKGASGRYVSKEDLERDLDIVREEIKSTRSPKKKPRAEANDSQLVVNDRGEVSRVPVSKESVEEEPPSGTVKPKKFGAREAFSSLGDKAFRVMFPTLARIVDSIEGFEQNEKRETAEERPRLDRELASNEAMSVSMESLVSKGDVTVRLLGQLLDEIKALRERSGIRPLGGEILDDLLDGIPGGARRDRTGRVPQTETSRQTGARPAATTASRLASVAQGLVGAATSAPVIAGTLAASSLGIIGAAIHRAMSMSPEEREAARQRAEDQAAAGKEQFEGRRDAAPQAATQSFYEQLPQGLKLEDVVDTLDTPESGETVEQRASRERMSRELASGNGRPTQEMIEYVVRRRRTSPAVPHPSPIPASPEVSPQAAARQERATSATESGAGGPAVLEQRSRSDFNEELRELVRPNELTRAQANDISRRVLQGLLTIEQARTEIETVRRETTDRTFVNRVSNVSQRSGELRKEEVVPATRTRGFIKGEPETRGLRKDESDESLVSEEVRTQEALAEQYAKDPALFSNRDLVMRAKSFKFEGDEIEFKQDYSQVQQPAPTAGLQALGGMPAPSASPQAAPQATASGATNLSVPEAPSGGGQATQVEGETVTAARDLNFASGVDPRINRDIADKVKQIQSAFGKSLTITSGYRDPQRNARAGGARNSAHTRANAVDVQFQGNEQDTIKFIEAASAAGIGGIGVYRPGWVHLDTESKRVWGPDFSSRSIPEWAKGALEAHMSGRSATQQQSQPGSGEAISAGSMGSEGTGSGGADATPVSGGGGGDGVALAAGGGGVPGGAASPVPSTPPTGMAVAAASTENAVAERTPVPPTVVQAGDTGPTPGNPSVGAPDYFHSPDDPGPVEPADAAERYARLFNMAA